MVFNMKNIELFLEYNNSDSDSGRVKFKKNKIIIDFGDIDCINGEVLKKIISCINYSINQYGNIHIPIMIYFKKVSFADKLTFVCLECICYHLIKNKGIKVSIFGLIKSDIWSEGINSSPLLLLNKKIPDTNSYLKKFKFDIFRKHYRKLVTYEYSQDEVLSFLFSDLKTFLDFFEPVGSYVDDICETIVELVGNALSHSMSDCLLDIDVTNNYKKSGFDNNEYIGINIIVINFSEKFLYSDIQNKISNDIGLKYKYQSLKKIYKYHKKHFFDSNYSELDFFNLASFQDKISGRENLYKTGGTGLTKLIKALQEKSDSDICYVLTNKNILHFNKKDLIIDKEDWISFNEGKSFKYYSPANGIIDKCKVIFPGTAYNLNFVIKINKSKGE